MKKNPLTILLLFDLSLDIKPKQYDDYWNTEEWRIEGNVRDVLVDQGHEVIALGVHDNIDILIQTIQKKKPDVVFNMSEAFAGKRDFEPNLVALLELLNIPYTGSGPAGLQLCKNKGITKEILANHEINIPKFLIAKRSHPPRNLKDFSYPAFIKPIELEASEGISQGSFVATEKEALDRIRFIHERLEVDAIVEEYIDGRELYVSILGNEKLTVFPPRELFFSEVPKGQPKFATFRAKWDDQYRKKWGIRSGVAKPLPSSVEKKMGDFCKKIYRHLGIRGYGRIDLRVKENGEIYFIEANPNPSIAKHEDFARSAAKSGLSYPELISKILMLAF